MNCLHFISRRAGCYGFTFASTRLFSSGAIFGTSGKGIQCDTSPMLQKKSSPLRSSHTMCSWLNTRTITSPSYTQRHHTCEYLLFGSRSGNLSLVLIQFNSIVFLLAPDLLIVKGKSKAITLKPICPTTTAYLPAVDP